MLDIKRKAPRFNVEFEILSNNILATGINISLKGVGFITATEMIPAYDIPFVLVINTDDGDTVHKIEGTGSLLFSEKSFGIKGYYCGIEFLILSEESKETLITVINSLNEKDVTNFHPANNDSLSEFYSLSTENILNKTEVFHKYRGKIFEDRYPFLNFQRESEKDAHSIFSLPGNSHKEMINFGSNDFLGLSVDPRVLQSGMLMAGKYGCSNRMLPANGGLLGLYSELESKIADFTGYEDAALFNSGYSALSGSIAGLVRANDAVIINQSCRAAISEGALIARAKRYFFTDFSEGSLSRILQRAENTSIGKIMVLNTMNAFTGELSPAEILIQTALRHNCTTLIDESYTIGITGKSGTGYCSQLGIKPDILAGSLSETTGINSGFVAGKKEVIGYIKCYSNQFIFNPPISPFEAGALSKALDLIREDVTLTERLYKNISLFKNGLVASGITPLFSGTPVVTLPVQDINMIKKISGELLSEGIYHLVLTYPFVPLGGSLLRFSLTVLHTDADIQRGVEIISNIFRKYGISGNNATEMKE